MTAGADRYRLIGDCASLGMEHLDHLQAMIEGARAISRRAFCRWADTRDRREWEAACGYVFGGRDLTAARDWAIAYYRSTWDGRPCVYLTWSAYEVIFVGERGRR